MVSHCGGINMKYHQGYTRQDVPDLLTAKDLEAILKIDVKTIYSYVRRGLIPYVRIQSNVRFLKSQIVGWIENQNYEPHRVVSKGRKQTDVVIQSSSYSRP